MLLFLAVLPVGAQDTVTVASSGEPSVDTLDTEIEACTTGEISEIEIQSRSIFDPEGSPRVLSWLYRTANALHINTQETFIARELLFDEGDCFDPFLITESQRLLETYGFFAAADVSTQPDGEGGHVATVVTRDDWSTKLDLGVTYDEGANLERFQATEENFLGYGVNGEFTYFNRRETRSHSFGVSTPRFFGRSDAGFAFGRSRPGPFFNQHLNYPFVGEAGRTALRENYRRGTDFFAFSTEGQEAHSQLLVPVFEERMELAAAHRFGEPGGSIILGVSLTRDVVDFRQPVESVFDDEFDEREDFTGTLPTSIARQLSPVSATRLGLHLGTRRFRYVEYEGLDGIRDRQIVGLGMFAGVSLAQGIPVFTASGMPARKDLATRGHASFTAALGSSLLHGGTTLEARRNDGRWRDILGSADLVFYGRDDGLPGHTLFLRASAGGGWNTELPFQLSLGGREAIRSLPEDVLPGGRMLLFVVEDRMTFDWPSSRSADFGATVFAEAGRVFPGEVPYGVDSGWQGSVGAGLRIGLPSGTRNIWRTDLVFPVGTVGSSPTLRVTFELNQFRLGFFNPEVRRSRRFLLGPEIF